ncbi:MAG: 3-hydroxyacyl-CoA dehydrogenase NAD-binding domain-containing protein [Arenibacterium sp.]
MTIPERIGVLGGGLVGMSWAALFLAHGRDVTIVDSRADAKAEMARFLGEAWGHLQALGLAEGGSPGNYVVTPDLEMLEQADYVQENLPDRLSVKQEVLVRLETVIGADVPIASSTSSLKASDIQANTRHPERIFVAHPMNPPHLVPMVELVAGQSTALEVMDKAEAFYRALGREVVRVKKEVTGHLMNRLTSALYREAVHLVASGIADVEDIDKAVAHGPGLRWSLMGPHMLYHLGGGAGGYRAYLDHLGPTQEARWKELGESPLDEATKARLVEGVDTALAGESVEELAKRRDAALVALLSLKKSHGF